MRNMRVKGGVRWSVLIGQRQVIILTQVLWAQAELSTVADWTFLLGTLKSTCPVALQELFNSSQGYSRNYILLESLPATKNRSDSRSSKNFLGNYFEVKSPVTQAVLWVYVCVFLLR